MESKDKITKDNKTLCMYDEIFNTYSENNLTNYAFPLYLFTMRLYDRLVKTNTRDVLFMSREGQFLKKLFERYCEIQKYVGCKLEYFVNLYGKENGIKKYL